MPIQILFAFFSSFLICIIFGKQFIALLKNLQGKGQPIREDGPDTHYSKAGTPTMGGLMIIFSCFVSNCCFIDILNPYVILVWFVILAHAVLGFIDDYLKIRKANVDGVPGKVKLLCQSIVSFITYIIIQKFSPETYQNHIFLPFFDIKLDIGYLYLPFILFVIIGASNAVNLTDGLDGLVTIPAALAFAFFGFVAYVSDLIPGSSELVILCASFVGGVIGFLWYNSYPAQIFMGDVGSLSIGAALGAISVILKQEFMLAIVGMLFVIETLSVIIQVYYFKISGGKRIFKMAPIHHHFEKLGTHEVKVVSRFWIFAFICFVIGLVIL